MEVVASAVEAEGAADAVVEDIDVVAGAVEETKVAVDVAVDDAEAISTDVELE